MTKPLLQILNQEKSNQIPFWFMRQAGRYLPEYRALRAEAGGFLNMVYNPERSSEVTLQPIRRFGMSGAILFSDILVIPQALGQDLRFETGEGPKLKALLNGEDVKKLNVDSIDETLHPIYETVKQVRQKLLDENFDDTTLIGFAGSPWTVACYMIEGGASKNFEAIKRWAYYNPDDFSKIINILSGATLHYLSKQVEAGVQVVQLFDSWAGILDEDNFDKWVIEPTRAIVDAFKKRHPDIPVIGFPRNSGALTLKYIEKTGIQAVGLDYTVSTDWAADNIPKNTVVQGNLDPMQLLVGGASMEKAALKILDTFADRSLIFNLGHGVIKETPPENVEKLSQIIREYSKG